MGRRVYILVEVLNSCRLVSLEHSLSSFVSSSNLPRCPTLPGTLANQPIISLSDTCKFLVTGNQRFYHRASLLAISAHTAYRDNVKSICHISAFLLAAATLASINAAKLPPGIRELVNCFDAGQVPYKDAYPITLALDASAEGTQWQAGIRM